MFAVGMEGAWGVVLCALALPVLARVRGPDGLPLDSVAHAAREIVGSFTLQWTTALVILSIGVRGGGWRRRWVVRPQAPPVALPHDEYTPPHHPPTHPHTHTHTPHTHHHLHHHRTQLFNMFGVAVTKRLSGASRASIDACRTLLIWLFCLRAGWERFHMLQVGGWLGQPGGPSCCVGAPRSRQSPTTAPTPAGGGVCHPHLRLKHLQ